jgi:hypothetical protein
MTAAMYARQTTTLAFAALLPAVLLWPGAVTARAEALPMKIRIDAGTTAITATLVNSETARDFAALLPLQLTLTDYAATEKVADLPRKLTTQGAPAGVAPMAGDIAYYAPWGNLAVFHRDFRHSAGLVKLGRVDSGLDVMRKQGPVKVTIELVRP